MSGEPIDAGNGVLISRYAGPAATMPDRRRWQVMVTHPDTGERQIVQLDSFQRDSLALYLGREFVPGAEQAFYGVPGQLQ